MRSLLHFLPLGAWPDDTSAASWTRESYLLADVVDVLHALVSVTLRAAGGKWVKPYSVKRPGAAAAVAQARQAARQESGAKTNGWLDAAKMLLGTEGMKRL